MKEEELKFWWPETGELTVKIRGNDSAVVRFKPSPAAVEKGLRIASLGAAYGHESDGQPHTQEKS